MKKTKLIKYCKTNQYIRASKISFALINNRKVTEFCFNPLQNGLLSIKSLSTQSIYARSRFVQGISKIRYESYGEKVLLLTRTVSFEAEE